MTTEEQLFLAQCRLEDAQHVLAYLRSDGWLGDVHRDGCPGDSTCSCPIPRDIDRVLIGYKEGSR